jgi:hypothetical protein
MRFIRCILLVLLALNLPGWAFAAMPACAIEHGSTTDAADSMHAAMGEPAPCCAGNPSLDDSAGSAACQDGGHCQCGALYQATQPLQAAVVPAVPGIDDSPQFHVITASALPHWRPPASV